MATPGNAFFCLDQAKPPHGNHSTNRGLILCFATVLLLPLFSNIVGFHSWVVLDEKRTLAAKPAMPDGLEALGQFASAYERYFNDHFGLRGDLVWLNTFLKYTWFAKSGSPAVMVGKDGWLFMARDQAIEQYRHIRSLSRYERQAWQQTLSWRQEYLQQKHIPYVYVVAPEKHSIYTEKMPKRLHQRDTPSRLAEVAAIANDIPGLRFIDLTATMQRCSTAMQSYFKTDSHWTWRGSYCAYQSLVGDLTRIFPDLPQLVLSDAYFAQTPEPYHDLANSLGLEVSAMAPHLTGTLPGCAGDIFANQPVWLHWLITQCGQGKHRALIFRDSYSNYLVPYLGYSFAETYFLWSQPSRRQFKQYVELLKPDIVIEERVERLLIEPPNPHHGKAAQTSTYAATLAEGIDFRREGYPEFVSDILGIDNHESWGRWSVGPLALIRFNRNLPSRFILRLTAQGFAASTREPVIVVVGKTRVPLQFGDKIEAREATITTEEPVDVLRFEIPKPIMAAKLLNNGDTRELGLGFIALKLLPANPPQ